MESIFSGSEPVGLPILSVHGFLRFVTHPRHVQVPVTFSQASAIVNSWLAQPNVSLLQPADRHWTILQQFSSQVRLTGAQITGAAIAATAIEYGATIHSNDRDFARFPGLRWFNPLQP